VAGFELVRETVFVPSVHFRFSSICVCNSMHTKIRRFENEEMDDSWFDCAVLQCQCK
jgi:hypothetical protein